MKPSKFYIFLSFILLSLPGLISAQTIRYVAYFPVPYLSHKTLTVNKAAYFAGLDRGSVAVQEAKANSLSTERDLEIRLGATTSQPLVQVGSLNNQNGTKGVFMVDKGQLTIDSDITSLTGFTQVNSDNNLKVENIYWGNNKVFDTSLLQSAGAKILCWLPLRVAGTYNYRYYLVAWNNSSNCPVCTAGRITQCDF